LISIKENQKLKKEVAELRKELRQKFSLDTSIIGQSSVLQKVFSLIEKASKTVINISITGQTGTGKVIVAKAIPYISDRKKKKFITVNRVADIPKKLIKSKLPGCFCYSFKQNKLVLCV